MSFALNEPVKVEQKAPNTPLLGIIAHLGEVSFSEESDWVGIRLVNTSVGRGKNDGSIKGVRYFKCAENGGVFVRQAAVQKWNMTKLEELRLKRELKGININISTSGSSSSGASVSSSSRSVSGSTIASSRSGGGDDDSSVGSASVRSSATGASNRSRLEEIRQRRLDLQRKNKLKSPPPRNIIATKTAGSSGASAGAGSGAEKRSSASAGSARKTSTSTSTSSNDAAGSSARTPVRSSRSKPPMITTTPGGTTPAAKTPGRRPPSTPSQGSKSPTAPRSVKRVSSTSGATARRTPGASSSSSASSSSAAEASELKEKVKVITQELKQKEEQIAALTEQMEKSDNDMRSKLSGLTEQLYQKEEESKQLHESLRKAEEMAHDAKLAVQEAKAAAIAAKKETEDVINATAAAIDAKEEQVEAETKALLASTAGSSGEEMQNLREEIADLTAQNEILDREKLALEDNLDSTQRQNSSLRVELERERESNAETVQLYRRQVSDAKAQVSTLEKELTQNSEKAALRDDNNAVHYKERAKLLAEVQSWKRKVKDMEKEKIDSDHALEDMTLDKEQLLEKIEALEDNFEELKIDAESAQIEVDELRMELEDARGRAEKAEATLSVGAAGGNVGGGSGGGGGDSGDTDDVVQALSVQNGRLREAILRLREQTSVEKMEYSRQLRAAEKDSSLVGSLKEKVSKLTASDSVLKEEVTELKEMVDQGAAFEQMVEDLSERVLAVEDDNIMLQGTIREIEEAGELSAEMEEAQADEIKALMKDVQSRDTIVINMEQAIKMQRRRELDFQRTVGNYRTTIETLQREKESLLTEIGGGEGVRNDAILASQKALSQAAQSVADAAAARKREAQASFHLIDAQVKSHLAERLEDFLPHNVASSEISAVKGELLVSKIAMKASLSLSSVADAFEKSMSRAQSALESAGPDVGNSGSLVISSALAQKIGVVLHETKFTHLAIELSSDCIKLLSIGQWPNLISSSASVDLGIFLAHSVALLDSAISEQLMILKREGCLSPHQSNLNILTQALTNTSAGLKEAVDEDGNEIIPSEWTPPCLKAFTLLSSSKFSCLGVATLIASIVGDNSDATHIGARLLAPFAAKMDKLCKELTFACDSLSGVDITDDDAVRSISDVSPELHVSCTNLFSTAEAAFSCKELDLSALGDLETKINSTAINIAKLTSTLRLHKIKGVEGARPWLSPETVDPWISVVEASRKAGEVEELNFLVRGRNLEQQLSVAVENDAKLSIAESKVKSLEKSLVTRSREVSMQNSRLQELESMLSQSAVLPSPQKSIAPAEESAKLQEEIRILNEAMEVTQSQVEEYEKEIRSLKDHKSRGSRRAPGSARKSASLDTDFSLSSLGISSPKKPHRIQESAGKTLSLDSALYRPALQSALSNASMWKAQAISDKLLQLPPLSRRSIHANYDLVSKRNQLSLACADVRNNKASVEIIKLSEMGERISKTSMRARLSEKRRKTRAAIDRLDDITNSLQFSLNARVA